MILQMRYIRIVHIHWGCVGCIVIERVKTCGQLVSLMSNCGGRSRYRTLSVLFHSLFRVCNCALSEVPRSSNCGSSWLLSYYLARRIVFLRFRISEFDSPVTATCGRRLRGTIWQFHVILLQFTQMSVVYAAGNSSGIMLLSRMSTLWSLSMHGVDSAGLLLGLLLWSVLSVAIYTQCWPAAEMTLTLLNHGAILSVWLSAVNGLCSA